MQKIIFERLTVKEEERVTAGNTSSNNTIPSAANKNCSSTNPTSVGNGCILEQITSNGKLNCTLADSELNCGYEIKIKLGSG
ncbi:MAG: hypothetical protein JSV88_26765 [Candidatus Aminicenantes bacterium]|nr:MAG: hypothetical protein JSV88_26765 [Candidatus Aminicenantes bacterium]